MSLRVISVLVVITTSFGCNQTDASSSPPAEAPAVEPSAPPAPEAVDLDPILSAYETLRESLAAGSVESLVGEATALEAAANDAEDAASDADKPSLNALATAATSLRETPPGDVEEARRTFGEVSRHLIGLLRERPDAAVGWRSYECPDALGYPHWIQPPSEMRSPYTDEACGEASTALSPRD